jgi:cytoskeletal protein CcmA (bactofilin family)
MWQKKSETKSSPVTETPAASAVEPKKTAPETANEVPATPAPAAKVVEPVNLPAAVSTATAWTPSAPAVAAAGGKGSISTASVEPEDLTGSRISAGLKIRGEISGTADIWIDGDVEGKVRVVAGRLTVGASGRVQADVEAREIVVNGQLVGNLKATDRVQIGSSGSVRGGVTSPRIGIDDGAQLVGNVETSRANQSQPAAKMAAASAGSTTAGATGTSPITVKKEGE